MHPDLDRLFSLCGRVAVVTGGSRGLGRACARGLGQAGADVVVASRTLADCEAVADDLRSLGVRTLPVAVRMREPDEVDRLVDATIEAFGRLDIVVNNAATVLDRPLADVTLDVFRHSLETNLFGPVRLVQAATEYLARSRGSVVNIVSVAAHSGSPDRYLYPAAKAALAQTTRSMARDLGPYGIRVNALSPGVFRTDMVARAYDEAKVAAIADATPLRRVAEPRELLGPLLMLVSDAGSFVTGAVLTVDGGRTA